MSSILQDGVFIFFLLVVILFYFVAGIVASDRFSKKSSKIDDLLSYNDFCFVLTVVFWPLVGLFGYLYFSFISHES